jgi:hypothetical protein
MLARDRDGCRGSCDSITVPITNPEGGGGRGVEWMDGGTRLVIGVSSHRDALGGGEGGVCERQFGSGSEGEKRG